MALYSGLDTIAIISRGVFTKTYGASSPGNIANLHASFGFLEDISTNIFVLNITNLYRRRRICYQ